MPVLKHKHERGAVRRCVAGHSRRVRSLSRRRSKPGEEVLLKRNPIIGADLPICRGALYNFDEILISLSRRQQHVRELRRARRPSRHGRQSDALDHWLRLSRRWDGGVAREQLKVGTPRGMEGLRSTRAATCSADASARSARHDVRFRMDEPQPVQRSLHAPRVSSTTRTGLHWPAGERRRTRAAAITPGSCATTS